MATAFIFDRDGNPITDTDIVPDGGYLSVPAQFRDGHSPAGDLKMADESTLDARLRFAAPEVRQRLGLPAFHLEDGKGGPAGFAPGYALGPHQLHDRKPRADNPARRAYADYVARLSSAWRNP